MSIGAAYIRVSTSDQVEFSPEAQRKAIVEYASKHKINIPRDYIFVDDGYSGKRADKRPAFMTMIKIAKSKPKPFDVIMVHRFDRFARSREDSVIYKSLLKREYDIRVISVTEQLEDDKFAIILESMLEAMAEYYSINLSEEVKKGMMEKARRGGFQSRPPFGYRVKDKGNLIQVEDEAAVVSYIYHQFLQGVKIINIARELNRIGKRTKLGHEFESRSISRILKNPIYMGYVRWNVTANEKGKVHINPEEEWVMVRGRHEPIVDDHIWQKTQMKLENHITNGKPVYSNSICCKHWLKGILKCQYCGGAMVYGEQKSKNYAYYRCNNHRRGKCEESNYMSVKILENSILKQVHLDLMDYLYNLEVKATIAKDELLYKGQIGQLKNKKIRIEEAYIEGIDSIEDYKRKKNKIDAQITEVNSELVSLSKEHKSSESEVISAFSYFTNKSYSQADKNKAIKSIIKVIYVDAPKEKFKFRYYLEM